MTHHSKIALLGKPVCHSLSPRIFEHWFRRYEINGQYDAIEVESEDLETQIQKLVSQGYLGANITQPHKQQAAQLAQNSSHLVQTIGSANILCFAEDQSIYADSSDGFGFLKSLTDRVSDWEPQNCQAVVIGAGGAAKAIIYALHERGVTEISVLSRNPSQAQKLLESLGITVKSRPLISSFEDFLAGATLVVNATSLGMPGMDEFPMSIRNTTPDCIIFDLVYARETKLLQEARETQRTAISGLEMLYHQARPAFEHWFHILPEIDSEIRKIRPINSGEIPNVIRSC